MSGKRWSGLGDYEHNLFAFCALLSGDDRAARRHFRACKGLVSKYPWSYIGRGEPSESFNVAQEQVGA